MRALVLSIVFVLGLLAWPGLARADVDAGLKAFEAGDYAAARRQLLPLKDDPRAAFVLGVMTEQGLGTPADSGKAAEFYDLAVRGGHVSAAVNLGVMYDEGRGVPRDGIRAQWLYSFAAKSDDVTGKNNLAYLWGRQNGLLEEALCLSAETLKAEPDNGAYLDTYGFVLLRLGRLDDAERFFDKVLKIHRDAVAAEHLGDVARLRGDSAGARRWWQTALGMEPKDHDRGRIRTKLAGQADDLDAHPAFQLRNDGFGKDCAMPAV